jgi:hypothetical protein
MGNLTKSNYEKIAEIINKYKMTPTSPLNEIAFRIALELADYFQSKDKNFKREQFLKDCGVKE